MGTISSDILAFSFDGLSSPNIDLKINQGIQKGDHTMGWGIAWYPNDTRAAIVSKDPTAKDESSFKGAINDWDNFRSTIFMTKIRGAASGYTHLETQPFSRNFAGQDWVFIHNGDLDKQLLHKLHKNRNIFLEPMGRTDSELAFCFLLGKAQEYGARTLNEIDHHTLYSWFLQLDELGSADLIISDGVNLITFRGSNSHDTELYYSRVKPPHINEGYHNASASFNFNSPRDTFRTAFVISSSTFDNGDWKKLNPAQMLIVKRGKIVYTNEGEPDKKAPPVFENRVLPQPSTEITRLQNELYSKTMKRVNSQIKQLTIAKDLQNDPLTHKSTLNLRSLTHAPDGTALTYRLYDVTHSTEYSYEKIVEHSTHSFRLLPVEDSNQEVLNSELCISSEGEKMLFEDVFGNKCLHYIINKPYKKLMLSCRSLVKIYGSPPDDFNPLKRHLFLPLEMMPWQKRMMDPYLIPIELPESQLTELMQYALSFAERNANHLMDTLNDINQTIYRDFQYVPGSTSLNSTAFDVYAQRKGVCQDFANLFIALARLLGVAARYRMGYIYTGANYENKIQSDASHAWVEIYIPYVGWRGFDPTNGCLVNQDHVRVACGRNYLDATPTSGTIYRGGGRESLKVEVTMNEVFL